MLGFELVDGRPGPADLSKVADTITSLGMIQCPDVPMKPADHWRTYVDSSDELERLKGGRLLHPTTTRSTSSWPMAACCSSAGPGRRGEQADTAQRTTPSESKQIRDLLFEDLGVLATYVNGFAKRTVLIMALGH